MENVPEFKLGEIVRIIDPQLKNLKLTGATGIVDEVLEGSRGRWRYRLICLADSDKEYFYEEQLETTGQFD